MAFFFNREVYGQTGHYVDSLIIPFNELAVYYDVRQADLRQAIHAGFVIGAFFDFFRVKNRDVGLFC